MAKTPKTAQSLALVDGISSELGLILDLAVSAQEKRAKKLLPLAKKTVAQQGLEGDAALTDTLSSMLVAAINANGEASSPRLNPEISGLGIDSIAGPVSRNGKISKEDRAYWKSGRSFSSGHIPQWLAERFAAIPQDAASALADKPAVEIISILSEDSPDVMRARLLVSVRSQLESNAVSGAAVAAAAGAAAVIAGSAIGAVPMAIGFGVAAAYRGVKSGLITSEKGVFGSFGGMVVAAKDLAMAGARYVADSDATKTVRQGVSSIKTLSGMDAPSSDETVKADKKKPKP